MRARPFLSSAAAAPVPRLRPVLAGILLVVMALAVTACTSPQVPMFDPLRADITAERGRARLETADALATATGGRLTAASARIDSCSPGDDNWKRRDPWALRCHFQYSVAITAEDIHTAAELTGRGLAALGCEDPRQLSEQLARWSDVNPGEPLPGSPDFAPGVLPPLLHTCGELEVWVRLSNPDDPLLEVEAGSAASTRDPVVVSARPFAHAELQRLRANTDRVVLFITAIRMYHEEPR